MSKSSNSWGHKVVRIPEQEVIRMREENKHNTNVTRYGYRCGLRCAEIPTFYCIYRYVTGAAGRTSESCRQRCEAHARNFAKRNGIEWEQVSA